MQMSVECGVTSLAIGTIKIEFGHKAKPAQPKSQQDARDELDKLAATYDSWSAQLQTNEPISAIDNELDEYEET
jgi:hypothetical protein